MLVHFLLISFELFWGQIFCQISTGVNFAVNLKANFLYLKFKTKKSLSDITFKRGFVCQKCLFPLKYFFLNWFEKEYLLLKKVKICLWNSFPFLHHRQFVFLVGLRFTKLCCHSVFLYNRLNWKIANWMSYRKTLSLVNLSFEFQQK